MKLRISFLLFFLLSFFLFSSCNEKQQTPEEKKDTTPPITIATPPGGIYPYPINVTLSTNEPATIYYTIGEKVPAIGDPDTLVGHDKVVVYIDHSTSLRFFSVDKAGNVENLKKEEYIIQKPPAQAELNCQFTDPASNIFINNSKIPYTVRGIAWAKNTVLRVVKVSPDGGATWYTADGTTKWRFLFNPAGDGDYHFLCKAGNGINLEEVGTSSVHVIVDNVPPEVSLSQERYLINAETSPWEFSGTASDNYENGVNKVEISRDGKVWVNTILNDNNWKYDLFVTDTNSFPGNVTLEVRAVDKAGNYSKVKIINVEEDIKAPAIEISSPKPWSFIGDDTTPVNLTFSEPVTVAVYGFDFITNSWRQEIFKKDIINLDDILSLSDGINFFNIVAVDKAGNYANKSLVLYKSGIKINGKFLVFHDSRIYFPPVTVAENFYGALRGDYYIISGDYFNSPDTTTAFFDLNVVTPSLNHNSYINSGDKNINGAIVNCDAGSDLIVAVYKKFHFGDSITTTTFYGVPVTVTKTLNCNYSFNIPSSILSRGVAVFAYQDSNSNGYWDCQEKAGYYKDAITSAGTYNFSLIKMSAGIPEIFIDGEKVLGTFKDLSGYTQSTTIEITGIGCGGWSKTYFDINGQKWVFRKYYDDFDGLNDGKIVLTLDDLFGNSEFETLPVSFETERSGKEINLRRVISTQYHFSFEITDVTTGNSISGGYLLLFTENKGYVFPVDNNGNVDVVVNNNKGFVPFLIGKNYVLEALLKNVPQTVENGIVINLSARPVSFYVTGKVVYDNSKPFAGSMVFGYSTCNPYGQTGIAPIKEDGTFSLGLTKERPYATSPIPWIIQITESQEYPVEITLSEFKIFSPVGDQLDIGTVNVGKSYVPALSVKNLKDKIFYIKDKNSSLNSFSFVSRIPQGKYLRIFTQESGKPFISLFDVDLSKIRNREFSFQKISNVSDFDLKGKISGYFSGVSIPVLLESPDLSEVFYAFTAEDGGFSFKLPQGIWQLKWGSTSIFFGPRTINSQLVVLNNNTYLGSLKFYIQGMVNVSFDFPSSWEGGGKMFILKNPITNLTYYSNAITASSGYVSFYSLMPGDYILSVEFNGGRYYYPSGLKGEETAVPFSITANRWWKYINFKIQE